MEITQTYPPEIQSYREHLQTILDDIAREAEKKIRSAYSATVQPTGDEIKKAHREWIDKQRPIIDELARIEAVHAQNVVIV